MSGLQPRTQLDERFVQRIQQQLGPGTEAFLSSLETEAPISVFINPMKDPGDCFENVSAIPWCSQGKYLDRRPDFTFDPLFHAGCYYVMEASSMFLHHVLASLLQKDKPICALDLCAAPGGKSVVTLSCLPVGSLLVSNEVNNSRFQILQYNIDKWGAPNVIRTCLDPTRIPWSGLFDVILIDAPCSGEGLFRKDKDARAEWSPANVLHCSGRQRRILGEAERLLAPGGLLIYSTCTYSDDENMHQVQWMTKQFSLTSKPVPVHDDWNITRKTIDDSIGYQFYPHQVRGEGFFCAIMEKAQDGKDFESPATHSSRGHKPIIIETTLPHSLTPWINPDVKNGSYRIYESIDGEFYLLQSAIEQDWLRYGLVRYPGTELGTAKIRSNTALSFRATEGSRETPSHALSLSHCLNPSLPSIELNREQAITYLRKESISAESLTPGWNVARYKGFALGWLKQTQAGLKNYLPTKYRIIKQQVK